MTTAFITGANSGLGRAAAIGLAVHGWEVYGSMRSLDKGEKLAAGAEAAGVEVHPVVCDVTDEASVKAAAAEVLERAGTVDVLVNNAGIGGNGTLEDTPIDAYERVMDANVYGIVRVTQAFLPSMRAAGSGTIVNVSSIAGRIAAIGQSPYVVSKWAVEGLSEGLAQEVAPHGIRVAIVEPGIIKTAIMAKNVDFPHDSGAYEAVGRRLFNFYQRGLQEPGRPEELIEVIRHAHETDDPKLRYTCGWGGPELSEGRPKVSDEDWVALGAITDDAEYYARFAELFGLDLAGE